MSAATTERLVSMCNEGTASFFFRKPDHSYSCATNAAQARALGRRRETRQTIRVGDRQTDHAQTFASICLSDLGSRPGTQGDVKGPRLSGRHNVPRDQLGVCAVEYISHPDVGL
jgi:hypothetical protein